MHVRLLGIFARSAKFFGFWGLKYALEALIEHLKCERNVKVPKKTNGTIHKIEASEK